MDLITDPVATLLGVTGRKKKKVLMIESVIRTRRGLNTVTCRLSVQKTLDLEKSTLPSNLKCFFPRQTSRRSPCIMFAPLVSPPSTDRHHSHVLSFVGKFFSCSLSRGIGAPVISFIFFTFPIILIVLLVRAVATFGVISSPHLPLSEPPFLFAPRVFISRLSST